ncbi:MAG: type II toxin-antitoxin system VapC family toxin [Methylacidiphilaceae bacterium]|nr:type II toxin-antitoxin system VapC family toxin [Candidatus Methylacidiphilaceae bacterium]
MLFCDTSTLAKYYVPEKDSAVVQASLDHEDQVAFSEFARAELMAVFHRRLREHKWTKDNFLAVVRQFSQDDISGYWTWLPLDSVILEQAVKMFTTLPESIFLRTADCLHLVTALHHGFPEIHTHDKHQIQAASVLGLTAIPIE